MAAHARDVTSTCQHLLTMQETALTTLARDAVDICAETPALARAVSRLLSLHAPTGNLARALPLAVLGALTRDPAPAIPVASLSIAWWAGAETLDDLLDGQFDPGQARLGAPEAGMAATTCLTVLPRLLTDRTELHPRLRALWISELTQGDLRCAEGQLRDVSTVGNPLWKDVVQSYVGKTGAPYARDAVLAGSLAGLRGDALRGWRAFGMLFGVLRQISNDRAAQTPENDADLANTTRTLLLAYALERLPAAEAGGLAAAHAQCRTEPAARIAVWNTLRRPDVADGYNARVSVMGSRLTALLRQLAAPSPYRDAIQWLINTAVETGRVPHLESAA